MDTQCLEELISLFLKINPKPSDDQFHMLANAVGVDRETLESISYGMLSDAEDLLDDEPEDDPYQAYGIEASHRLKADSQDILQNVAVDPDDMSLTDVAMNDGDPTDDDIGLQEETKDDGVDVDDKGTGLINNVSDALTDDGVPDYSLE